MDEVPTLDLSKYNASIFWIVLFIYYTKNSKINQDKKQNYQLLVFDSIRMVFYLLGRILSSIYHQLMYYSYQIISLELCVPIVASITCYKHPFLDYATFTT